MPLETGTLFSDLNASWPTGGDNFSEGDDHLRLIKAILKGTFTDNGTTFTITKGGSTFTFGSDGSLLVNGASVSGGFIVSDTPPPDPVDGTAWWDSSSGALCLWYEDADSGQWVQVAPGGGGGGDDIDTTPVAAIGSSIEQTIPEWFAGAPIIEVEGELFVGDDHRGAWVHLLNDVGTVIYLPDDWLPGWSFGARQIGTGAVGWVVIGGASLQIPFTKATHTSILEQYEDVVFRVISNSDGESAVWSFSGATA